MLTGFGVRVIENACSSFLSWGSTMVKKSAANLTILFCLTLIAVLVLLAGGHAIGQSKISYEVVANKKMNQKVPEIKLSDSDKEKLYAGKPICRLIDNSDGLKSGYMRIFLPFEPPTAWRVVLDCDCFDLVSPEFPENKGRRTFMPYTFDAASCTENGRFYFYQLLVMPLVSPRHFTLDRVIDQNGFPWETKWSQVPEMHCKDKWNKEMDSYRNDAVLTLRNNGTWHIGPIPKEFVKTKEDLLKTEGIYFVDTNPGGNLALLKPIINKATQIAMPALADSTNFIGKRWEEHMKKYHAGEYQTWKQEIAEYRKSVGYAE
jgi:hypothetical protein